MRKRRTIFLTNFEQFFTTRVSFPETRDHQMIWDKHRTNNNNKKKFSSSRTTFFYLFRTQQSYIYIIYILSFNCFKYWERKREKESIIDDRPTDRSRLSSSSSSFPILMRWPFLSKISNKIVKICLMVCVLGQIPNISLTLTIFF